MKRNIALSYCRVIAMIFIVLCHIINYYTMIPFYQYMSEFFRVGVEMFIILSGYLYGSRQITGFKSFYLKRYLKICLPVQLWIVIIFVVWHEMGDVRSFIIYFMNLSGLSWIKKDLLPPYGGNGMGSLLGHTWFVTIIVLCYLLIPLIQKICSRLKKENILCGLLLLWFVTIMAAFNGIQIYYFALFLSAYFAAFYNIRLKEPGGGIKQALYSVVLFLILAGRIPLHQNIRLATFYDNVYVHMSQSLFAIWIMITICALYKSLKKYMDSLSKTCFYRCLEKLSYFIYIVQGSLRVIVYDRYTIWQASVIFITATIGAAMVIYWISQILEKYDTSIWIGEKRG